MALRWTGEQARAAAVLDEALEHARALDDERLAARVEIEASTLRAMTDPRVSTSELVRVAEDASLVFRASNDEVGLAKAWILLAEAHWIRGSVVTVAPQTKAAHSRMMLMRAARENSAGRLRCRLKLGSVKRANAGHISLNDEFRHLLSPLLQE